MFRHAKTSFLIVGLYLSLQAIAADITPVGEAKVETSTDKADKTVESKAAEPLSARDDKPAAAPSPVTQPSDTLRQSKQNRDTVTNDKSAINTEEKVIKSSKRVAYKGSPNSFNRLMKPPSKRNLPPAKDGIHDPDNDGTHILQAPKDSFDPLPKSNSGNRVDWVGALENGDIQPRYDRLDPEKQPIVLDLNIVREVKGSMPDVVYPHKQHTEWLDCSNCHPAIFIPMKGANNISMASILLGEKCGVCHGKVAFPVSECRKCHSKKKTE